jgi:WD40 repeat protein
LEFANELFLFNDYLIISCGTDNKIKIWDVQSGQLLNTLSGRTDWVNSVAFSPDNLKIISGGGDCSVKIWDTHSGQLLNTLNSHTNAVLSVAYSFDNSRIASGGHDHSVKIWDTHTGKLLNTLVDPSIASGSHLGKDSHSDVVYSVAFSFDNSRIASGGRDNSVKIWDAQSGQLLNTLIDPSIASVGINRERWSHISCVYSVAFSPDNLKIASGSGDCRVKIWDAQSGQLLNTLIDPGLRNQWTSHISSVYSVAFSPSGESADFLLAKRGSNKPCLFDRRSFDNLRIVSCGFCDNIVKIWDVQSGQLINTLIGHTDWVNSVAYSPDNLRIVSGSHDRDIKIWDALSGQLLNTLDGHIGMVNSVAFSSPITYPIDAKLREYLNKNLSQ